MCKTKPLFVVSKESFSALRQSQKEDFFTEIKWVGSFTLVFCWVVTLLLCSDLDFIFGEGVSYYVTTFLFTLFAGCAFFLLRYYFFWAFSYPPPEFHKTGFTFPDDSLLSLIRPVRKRVIFILYEDISAIEITRIDEEIQNPCKEYSLLIRTKRGYTREKITHFQFPHIFKDETLSFFKKAMGKEQFEKVFRDF